MVRGQVLLRLASCGLHSVLLELYGWTNNMCHTMCPQLCTALTVQSGSLCNLFPASEWARMSMFFLHSIFGIFIEQEACGTWLFRYRKCSPYCLCLCVCMFALLSLTIRFFIKNYFYFVLIYPFQPQRYSTNYPQTLQTTFNRQPSLPSCPEVTGLLWQPQFVWTQRRSPPAELLFIKSVFYREATSA